MGAFAPGGSHGGPLYLWHADGLSQASLDLLQEVDGVLCQLSTEWAIAGHFNRTPGVLQKSGWLQLVRGPAHQPGRPTCNGKVYDFCALSRVITEAVAGVAVVEGAVISPHRPP